MTDIQDKFMRRLKAIPREYEIIEQKNTSNAGTLYIQPHESFNCVMRIDFNFQKEYARFEVTPLLSNQVYRTFGGKSHFQIKAPFEGLDSFINDILMYLKGTLTHE